MWFPLSMRFRCLQILNLLNQFENSCAFTFYWFPVQKHSRPQSPSFLGRLQIKPSGSGDANGARERFNEAVQRKLLLRWRPWQFLLEHALHPNVKVVTSQKILPFIICSLNRNLEWKVQCRIQTLRWWGGWGRSSRPLYKGAGGGLPGPSPGSATEV